jgi:hypothetical protein
LGIGFRVEILWENFWNEDEAMERSSSGITLGIEKNNLSVQVGGS